MSPIIATRSWSIPRLPLKPGRALSWGRVSRNRGQGAPRSQLTMIDQKIDCLTEDDAWPLPLRTVRPYALEAFLSGLPEPQRAWLHATDFDAKAGELRLLPGTEGLTGAVLGLGEDRSPHVFGALPAQLPAGSVWRLASGDHDPASAALGFCLGYYRYTGMKPNERRFARLVATPDQGA